MTASPRPRAANRAQRGFTLIEMTVVMTVATVVTVLGARAIANAALSAAGEGTAAYLNTLRGAVARYITTNYNEIGAGLPVAGFADTRRPTLAEMRAARMLPSGFPDFAPFNIAPAVRVDLSGCPGLACRLDALIWLSQPIRDSAGQPRLWLAQEIRAATEGGLASDTAAPGALRGSVGSVANPLGTVAGAVGATTSVDTAMFNQFVRRNDARPTALDEALTVNAGPLSSAGVALQVNGNQATSGNASIGGQFAVLGSASFGSSVAASGTLSVNNASARILDASGAPRVVLTAAGLVQANDASALETASIDGAAGRVTAQRLRATSSASSGAACGVNGDLVMDASAAGTILVCRSGVWRRPGLQQASAGSACTTPGSVSLSVSEQMLICRSNGMSAIWYLANDRMGSVLTADIWSGNGVGNVPAPHCGANGTPDVLVAALQGGSDYGVLPPRNRFEIRVAGTGPWTVTPAMVDQMGNASTSDSSGNPYSLGWSAATLCRYPA